MSWKMRRDCAATATTAAHAEAIIKERCDQKAPASRTMVSAAPAAAAAAPGGWAIGLSILWEARDPPG